MCRPRTLPITAVNATAAAAMAIMLDSRLGPVLVRWLKFQRLERRSDHGSAQVRDCDFRSSLRPPEVGRVFRIDAETA